MATYYVNSAATGTADGSSYTNAVTTFAAGVAKLAAGDNMQVLAGTHTESTGAATTYTFPGTPLAPNTVEWTDVNGNPTASSTAITTAGLTIAGTVVMTFSNFASSLTSSTNMLLAASPAGVCQKYVDPTWSITSTGTAILSIGTVGGIGRCEWIRPVLKLAGAGNSIKPTTHFTTKGAWTISGVVPTSLFTGVASSFLKLQSPNFSFVTTTIVAALASSTALVSIEDPVLASGVVVTPSPTVIGASLQVIRAGSNYNNSYFTYRGTLTTEITLVRTGSPTDNGTATSWKMVSNAGVSFSSAFEAPIFGINNTVTGTRNVTLHGIWFGAALPTNDQTWFDVLDGAGAITSGTKASVLATGTALSADTTSAWDSLVSSRVNSTAYVVGALLKVADNSGRVFRCTTAGTTASAEPSAYANAIDGTAVTDGTAVFTAGYRFQQTVTASPTVAGILYPSFKLGTPSATVYWDPTVILS